MQVYMLVCYPHVARRVGTRVGPSYTGRSVHLALCLRSTNFTMCFTHTHTHTLPSLILPKSESLSMEPGNLHFEYWLVLTRSRG